MKRIILFILLILFIWPAFSQPKTRGKIKRKYRDVERVQEALPPVFFRGIVRDAARVPVAGASVEVEGLPRLVHTNERGEFLLTDLPTTSLRIRVACLGYLTKTFDYVMQQGYNDHYVTLDRGPVPLEPILATAQNREQHLPDIPGPLSSVTRSEAERLGIRGFSALSEYLPALWFENYGAGNSGFATEGSTGIPGFPGLSPEVAVFSDQVPVMQPGGFSPEFFDMERVEVLKGSQNTLFGRNALSGAVHLVSRKPENSTGGYLSAGAGSFWHKETEGAINVPLFKDRIFIRAAGIFRDRKGYIENSEGGTLNGLNTWGGRFSLRLLPAPDHQADLQLNYRKSGEPGTGFLNRRTPGEEGYAGLFSRQASLNRGDDLGSGQRLMEATLTYRFFLNEHNYLTSVSSYRRANNSAAWDADGTSLPALEMDHESAGEQFFQEFRYNFMRRSRSIGSAGLSYLREKEKYSYSLWSNDQHIYDLLADPGNFLLPEESPFPVFPQPLNPDPMSGILLSGDHNEGIFNRKAMRSVQAFIHVTRQLKRRLFFTGGIRAFYDRMQLFSDSVYSGGNASTFGQYTGAEPNLLFPVAVSDPLEKGSLSFTGQAGLTYRRTENFNFYLQAVRGRKPRVLQYAPDGRPAITDAGKVYSLEAGWRTIIVKQIFWEAHGFYRRHMNVHTLLPGEAERAGIIDADGKATSYGAETGLKFAIASGLDVFGNYAWMLSSFDSTGVSGTAYPCAGNSFALAPDHSFSAGVSGKVNIAHRLHLFANPWYSWKSHYWFSAANTPGLEQPAFGLLNMNCGLEMDKPDVVLSIYGTNLLNQRYIAGTGHWGGLSGLPAFIPGAPRVAGIRLKYSF